MVNLAARVEQFTLAQILERTKAAEREAAYLRSSGALIGRGHFPDRVIPPNALAQATAQPGLVNLTQTGFALTTSAVDLISATVTVPGGFTGCVVNVTGRVWATNPNGSKSYLSARVRVGGVTGNAVPVPAAASDVALNPATLATLLTGLMPGGIFTVALAAWADVAWAATAGNLADLVGSIVWVP